MWLPYLRCLHALHERFRLTKRLNALGATLPIIFITGHGDIPMEVNVHRSQVMKKLAVKTLAELVRFKLQKENVAQ